MKVFVSIAIALLAFVALSSEHVVAATGVAQHATIASVSAVETFDAKPRQLQEDGPEDGEPSIEHGDDDQNDDDAADVDGGMTDGVDGGDNDQGDDLDTSVDNEDGEPTTDGDLDGGSNAMPKESSNEESGPDPTYGESSRERLLGGEEPGDSDYSQSEDTDTDSGDGDNSDDGNEYGSTMGSDDNDDLGGMEEGGSDNKDGGYGGMEQQPSDGGNKGCGDGNGGRRNLRSL